MIRTATLDALGAIVALETAFPLKERWSENAWREELSNPERVILMTPDAVLDLAPGPDATDLLRIVVAESARGKGLASRLIEAGLARCPGRWMLEVRDDNLPAQRLYEKFGFTQITRRADYYGQGVDALIYERKEDA